MVKTNIIRGMYYFEVWVRSSYYHGSNGLTYSSKEPINVGTLVSVELKDALVSGVVMSIVTKPKFKVKQIVSVSPLPPLPSQNLELMRWLGEYYPSPVGIVTQQFIPAGVMSVKSVPESILEPAFVKDTLPKLTPDQTRAIARMKSSDTFMLHGRTGSGKTRIYQELALGELSNGRSVIMLTPEISLTAQLENEFRSIFGTRVIVLHSTLSSKERTERWASILSQSGPLVVIGPRSAIFSPLARVGLIIIDEEHEPAYKQQQAPYYVTTRVAGRLRELHGSKLILGSATPLVTDYYLAQTRNK